MNLLLYAVRNAEGKWFRAKGYGGYGDTWVNDVNSAKLYAKIGQAKSRCSFFYNKWPEFGVPHIVKIEATGTEILDMKEHVFKQSQKRMFKKEKRDVANKKHELSVAQENLKKALKTIEDLK